MKAIRFIICLIALLLVLLLALPTLASTGWGQAKILTVVNSCLPGTLSIERWNLSWFGKQQMDHLSYSDASSGVEVKLEKLTTEASLFSFLKATPSIGETSIAQLNIALTQHPEEPSAPSTGSRSHKADCICPSRATFR